MKTVILLSSLEVLLHPEIKIGDMRTGGVKIVISLFLEVKKIGKMHYDLAKSVICI